MQQLYPSLISRLKTQHEAIENIISTIDDARLIIRPLPSKWNIVENIAHLTRYQEIFMDRLNIILNTDNPFIGRYVAEEDNKFETFKQMDLNTLQQKLNEDRNGIYLFIKKLTIGELNKIGIHKKFGPLNIIQWTEFFILHESHHLFTIFQLAHDSDLN